ncbi:uncharacterized protein LOC126618231 [Malus sylvestris]|uniref:uncharacterized protein LOC126618231 n=1 Tax=Malus sylvestris TaxID=3752 RepID=UPI0021AC71ED|nr:uncharacterized protein LOC126618231 [Malus sylvestris]
MSGPSDRRFDLNLVEEAAPPSPDNIWRPSFVSPTGPLTVGDSVMKNDMTAAVVARNLLTPKDNRLLSKRSDELAVKDSLALSVQCAGSVSNMAQRLFARTRQVESLAAEVMSLKQEIRGLKHENKQLHRLAHDYATNMKRKLDQMKEYDGQVLLDHQRFVGLFQRHLLPSSSRAVCWLFYIGGEGKKDEFKYDDLTLTNIGVFCDKTPHIVIGQMIIFKSGTMPMLLKWGPRSVDLFRKDSTPLHQNLDV